MNEIDKGPWRFFKDLINKIRKEPIKPPEKPVYKKVAEIRPRNRPERVLKKADTENLQKKEVSKKIDNIGRPPSPKEAIDILSDATASSTVEGARLVLGLQQLKSVDWSAVDKKAEWQKINTAILGLPKTESLTSADDIFLRQAAEKYASVFYYQNVAEIAAVPGSVDWVGPHKDFAEAHARDLTERTAQIQRAESEGVSAQNILKDLDDGHKDNPQTVEEIGKLAWPPKQYTADDGSRRIGALLGASDYADWIQTAAGKTDNPQVISFLVNLAESGPDALKDPKFLFTKAVQFREKLIKPMSSDAASRGGLDSILQDMTNQIQKCVKDGAPLFEKIGPNEKMGQIIGKFPVVDLETKSKIDTSKWFVKDSGGKVHFYDDTTGKIDVPAGSPIADQLNGLAEEFNRLQNQINSEPESLVQGNLNLRGTREKLDSIMYEIRAKGGVVPGMAVEKYQELLGLEIGLYDHGHDYTGLGLDEQWKVAVREKGFTAVVEEQMRIIEKNTRSHEGDMYQGQAAAQTMQYLFGWSQYPGYINEWTIELSRKGLNNEQIAKRLKEILDERDMASKIINARKQLLSATTLYHAAGIPSEKMPQVMSPIGDEGPQFLLTINDGRIAKIRDFLDEYYNSGQFVEGTDDTRRYYAQTFEKLSKDMEQDLEYASDLFGLTPGQIEEAAFLADELATITDRKVVMIGKGKAPQEDNVHHMYLGGDRAEEYASDREFGRFKFFRWAFLDNVAIHMYESSSYFVAKMRGAEKVISARIAEASSRPGGKEELVKELCFITERHMSLPEPDRIKTIEDHLKTQFRSKDMRANKRTKNVLWAKKIPKTLEEAAKDEKWLKERMMIQVGSKQYDRSLMSYTYYDSGPMVSEVLGQIREMFEPNIADTLGINMSVRDAYANLLGAKDHSAKHHAEHALKHELQRAAKYNPLELFRAHVAHHDFYTKDWFSGLDKNIMNAFLSDKEMAKGIQSSGDLVKALGKRLIAIDTLVKDEVKQNKFIARIDWSKDLSAEHSSIVRRVLQSFSGASGGGDLEIGYEEFTGLMQDISTQVVGQDYSIHRMMDIDYWDYGYQTESVHDSWLDLLEQPDKYGNKTGHTDLIKLSHRLGAKNGYGSGSLLVRNHGDKEPARKCGDLMLQFYTKGMDQKSLMEAIKEIAFQDRMVYGSPWDKRSVIYLLSGLLDQAAVDSGSEWTFGTLDFFAPKNSPLRRLLNEKAEGWTIHDRYEFVEIMENQIRSNLHEIDHEMADGFLQYVKINMSLPGFNKIANGNVWKKRMYTVGAIAAVSGAIALGGVFLSEAKVTSPGSGGGGGDEHVPQHH